jgi:hypothetical protein
MSPEIHVGTKSVATPHDSNFNTNSSAFQAVKYYKSLSGPVHCYVTQAKLTAF